MPKRMIDVRDGQSLFDIASYGQRGSRRTDRLSSAEIEQISRTVSRTPEVMLKVLTKGTHNLGALQRHLDYISRGGELGIETEEGERLKGEGIEKELLEDWDLELDAYRRRVDLSARNGREPPKLFHKLMFSMPAGTPPDKVLVAVRTFAREQFALKHRYAMVLHTDEPHPHVHMLLKAVSEQGVRLHIRKATLRAWRQDFARYLREQGVAANATKRQVRGESRTQKNDGIYRATLRGDSVHTRERTEAVAAQLLAGTLRIEPGKLRLVDTRKEVERGWRRVSDTLMRQEQSALAVQVERFVDQMPSPRTEKELIASELLKRSRNNRVRDRRLVR